MKRTGFVLGIAALTLAAFSITVSAQSDVAEGQPQSRIPASQIGRLLGSASQPPKFFLAPTSSLLRSFEVSLSVGSSYGVGNGGGLLARGGFGLGGIAEVEFATSEVINELTGETTRFPTRSFKVGLVPESLRSLWYVPNVAAQLRTSDLGEVASRGGYLKAENMARTGADGAESLTDVSLESRFTTLYIAAGKNGSIGGLHLGFSVTDVRTKQGWQWIYNWIDYTSDMVEIPEMSKNVMGPYGGFILNMNPKTQLMTEVEPVPEYKYDINKQKVYIRRAWMAIAGVRFFIGRWLTWDTGVRYQSNFDGIADAQINITLNMILPLKTTD